MEALQHSYSIKVESQHLAKRVARGHTYDHCPRSTLGVDEDDEKG